MGLWVGKCVSAWVGGTYGSMDVWKDVWMNGWVDTCVDGRVD